MRSTYVDPDVGMIRVPGSSVFHEHPQGGYLAKCNSLGMRDSEVSPARVDGRRRLVVVGDSFTFGSGVEVADRFTTRLAELLPEWDIVNFGLSGTGVDQQYLAWKKFASNIEHDVVVVTSWAENIRRNEARYRLWDDRWAGDEDGEVVWVAKPYFTLDAAGALELHHVPCPAPRPYDAVGAEETDTPRFNRLRVVVRRFGPGVKDRVQRLLRVQPVPEYDSADAVGWQLLRAILEQWQADAGAAFVFAPIPMYQHIEGRASGDAYQSRLQELSDVMNVVDVLRPMQGIDDRRSLRFEVDTHFSPRGHEVYASALADGLTPVLDQLSN